MPSIVIEKTFDHPVASVWKALITKEAIRTWSFEVDDFQPKVGFEYRFAGGTPERTYWHHCKVLEVVPGKKLCYSWQYEDVEGMTKVTWELFPAGERTRLVLTHEGVENLAHGGPDFASDNFNKGWTAIANNIASYLAKGH
jgi:uncharacterized protein YndB with AHSA1/START domain